jgi:hypothetical protein
MALLLKLVMLVKLTDTTVAHKSMKAPPTKRGGADAERAMNNETLHWHEVTGKQKKQALGAPVGCSGRTRVVGVSLKRFFEAHGLPYHFGIEFLRKILQVLCPGFVGDTKVTSFDGAWSSRYFIKGTVNSRYWYLFDDAILDAFVKAHKLIGGEMQRDHVTKEDAISPRVIGEAMMPTCTQEKRGCGSGQHTQCMLPDSGK